MLSHLLKTLLSSFAHDPALALSTARPLIALLAAHPALLEGLLPANSSIPVVMYAKANPEEVIAFLGEELDLLTRHEALYEALVASAPHQGSTPHA